MNVAAPNLKLVVNFLTSAYYARNFIYCQRAVSPFFLNPATDVLDILDGANPGPGDSGWVHTSHGYHHVLG